MDTSPQRHTNTSAVGVAAEEAKRACTVRLLVGLEFASYLLIAGGLQLTICAVAAIDRICTMQQMFDFLRSAPLPPSAPVPRVVQLTIPQRLPRQQDHNSERKTSALLRCPWSLTSLISFLLNGIKADEPF